MKKLLSALCLLSVICSTTGARATTPSSNPAPDSAATVNAQRPGAARKAEVTALLQSEQEANVQQREASRRTIAQYLADQSIPEADRCDVSMLAKELRADRSAVQTRMDDLRIRVRNARELIQEFPEATQGYGYLLSIAKSAPGKMGLHLAQEIINHEKAPARIRAGAQQVVAQRQLLGQTLQLDGIDLTQYRGQPLVVYTWTLKQPDIFSMVKIWSETPGVQLLGINLDADPEAAKALAHTQNLPGHMLYDGGANQKSLGEQLHLISPISVYLVDAEGRLIDVNGMEDTLGKLEQLSRNASIQNGGAK